MAENIYSESWLRPAQGSAETDLSDRRKIDFAWPPRDETPSYIKRDLDPLPLKPIVEREPTLTKAAPAIVERRNGKTNWRVAFSRHQRLAEVIIIALAVTAIPETFYLAVKFAAGNQDSTTVSTAPQAPASSARAQPEAPAPAVPAASGPVATSDVELKAEDAARRRATLGSLAVSVPIQLQIFEHGVFLGTSDKPLKLVRGSHDLELVNESVPFREHRSVQVRAGATTPLAVNLPSGRLQVNAVPWSEVLIDGQRAGYTPLGNLRLPIGPHRIVFRHPQLGEQIRNVVIGPDAPSRLSVDFRR